MNDIELVCMELISKAGGAKSLFLEAIECAKDGNYEQATKMISEGEVYLTDAHKTHFGLIQKEAQGESITMTLLLTHAEDQLISTEIVKLLSEQVVELTKNLQELKQIKTV